MKKIKLLFSMVILTLSLTACANANEGLGFTYNKADIQAAAEYNTQVFQTYTEDQEEQLLHSDEEMAVNLVTGLRAARDEAGSFEKVISTTLEEKDTTLNATVLTQHAKRNVEYVFVYEANPEYEYTEGALPYICSEITVNPVYSFGESMEKAGLNTLMGMGTVFLVLIFISFIISFFKYIPNGSNNKKREVANIPSSQPVVSGNTENLMNDTQLVAVITAAIYAAEGSNEANSKDQLVVRSIKRAKR